MFIAGAPELAVRSAAIAETPRATVTPTDQHALKVRCFKYVNLPVLDACLAICVSWTHSCMT